MVGLQLPARRSATGSQANSYRIIAAGIASR